MLLADVARVSAAVAATASRTAKVELIAGALRSAPPDEAGVVAAYLSGELTQRRTGVGYGTLAGLATDAAELPGLTVGEVDRTLDGVAGLSGRGSAAARRAMVADLYARATALEQRLLSGLLSGELRQGAQDALVVEAVAAATGTPPAAVQQAVMLAGATPPVAAALLADGPAAVGRFRLTVGSPVRPMLASPASGVADALEHAGRSGWEWKLDGVRIQVHRSGTDVAVFSRTLDDVTARVPELAAVARALPAGDVVLDGEAIALDADARPRPFQVTAGRFATHRNAAGRSAQVPLTPFLFDALHLDGEDLLGQPGATRWSALAGHADPALLVPRLVTADPDAARTFVAGALARGHEGVVVKSLDAPYAAGRRGAGWLKVKPRHTLDLVVLAAERGHGRRRGWLSNLHLGARDPATGGFVMLGKTFKGLTDRMLAWQTERLRALAVADDGWTVQVRPELVVEVAFDGVQTSPRYPGGLALRFARVVRHRPDKTAAEADTLDAVRAIHTP